MKLIQVTEAARRLGVNRQTLENWGKDGSLKIRTMGKTGNAHWVDEATIEAMADTANDVAKAQEAIKAMAAELQQRKIELKERVREIRHDIIFVNKAGTYCYAQDFYLSIPDMMHRLGVITARETEIVIRIIQGDDMEEIGSYYGLTRERIRQIFYKALRRSVDMKSILERLQQAEKDSAELEYLRKKSKQDDERIIELEEKLNLSPSQRQEAADRELMMTRLVDCNLSVRALNCLKAADIETIGDLVQLKKETLLQFRNFGKKTLRELDDFLESLHLTWGTKVYVREYSEPDEYGNRSYKGLKLVDESEI